MKPKQNSPGAGRVSAAPARFSLQVLRGALVLVIMGAGILGTVPPLPFEGARGIAAAAVPVPKYYFRLRGVEATVPVDGGIREQVAKALQAELSSRPEWQSEIGAATSRDDIAAELKRRKLSGFELLVKITQLSTETHEKEGRAASRLKRLSVTVNLAVLGTTLPGEKMAFSGDGQTSYETEVPETRIAAETQTLVHDAIGDAIKQAVDQALLKLAAPKSVPVNESKNPSHKKRKHP